MPENEQSTDRARAADPEDRMWQNRLEQDQLQALPNIRASAEKWAGTIASLTGVFGIAAFVKGRDDIYELTELTRYIVGGFLVAAVICAFVAVYRAALAAQGTPTEVYAGTPKYRNTYLMEAKKAMNHLYWSRVLTIVATVLLAIATGIMWFGPVAESNSPTRAMVVQRSGATLCGTVTTEADGTLAFTPNAGSTAIPLTDVSSFMTVAECPKK